MGGGLREYEAGGRGPPGSSHTNARLPRVPCFPPVSLLSLPPGSRLRGEGQGTRTAEDQQGRGSLPWERLQRQVPGPRQESPSPAPPGQEAQRADQPEKEQKERQGEMKVLVTSLLG